jgi:hypothetical protein
VEATRTILADSPLMPFRAFHDSHSLPTSTLSTQINGSLQLITVAQGAAVTQQIMSIRHAWFTMIASVTQGLLSGPMSAWALTILRR